MMKTIRKILGMEKFEMPYEPSEFGYIRTAIKSYAELTGGGFSMSKTPENPAVVVQIRGTKVPPSLELRLKELAELHGFEVEVSCDNITYNNNVAHSDMAHSNMSYTDSPVTNPELTQEDYDRMIEEDRKKEVN